MCRCIWLFAVKAPVESRIGLSNRTVYQALRHRPTQNNKNNTFFRFFCSSTHFSIWHWQEHLHWTGIWRSTVECWLVSPHSRCIGIILGREWHWYRLDYTYADGVCHYHKCPPDLDPSPPQIHSIHSPSIELIFHPCTAIHTTSSPGIRGKENSRGGRYNWIISRV